MFLEHAEDDEVDPDAAVRGIEVISNELDALESGYARQAREVPFMLWGEQ